MHQDEAVIAAGRDHVALAVDVANGIHVVLVAQARALHGFSLHIVDDDTRQARPGDNVVRIRTPCQRPDATAANTAGLHDQRPPL